MTEDQASDQTSARSLLELYSLMEDEGQRLAVSLGYQPEAVSTALSQGGVLLQTAFSAVTGALGLGPDEAGRKLREQVDGLLTELASLKNERSGLPNEVATLASGLEQLDDRLQRLEQATLRAQAVNRILDQRLSALDRRLAAAEPRHASPSVGGLVGEVPARAVRAFDSVLKIAAERAASIFADKSPIERSTSPSAAADTPIPADSNRSHRESAEEGH